MYNFIKKALHLEKQEEIKINDPYLNSILYQAELNGANEKTLKHIKEIIISIIKKDKKTFKDLSSLGIPEESPLLRSLIWKINLKFLDFNVDNWSDVIAKKRSEYNNMKEAFMMKMEIDKKMNEDSNGNNNNIIRKNGDSINETEEESKDSSNKSKNNSKNNLNNNNSKSKMSNNYINNKDNIEGLNINNSKVNNNNNHWNSKNFNEEENEIKNISDKNLNSGLWRNPTFGKIDLEEIDFFKVENIKNSEFNACFVDNSIKKNFNSSKLYNNNDEISITNKSLSMKQNTTPLIFEGLINKNASDFSSNFLNMNLDERKLKKNKKFKDTNISVIFEDNAPQNEETLQSIQAPIRKFDIENKEASNSNSINNNFSNLILYLII